MVFFDINRLMDIARESHQVDVDIQIFQLSAEIEKRDQKIIHLDQEIQKLNEQLDWFKRQIFGKRSERVVGELDSKQLFLEGFEELSQPKKSEKKTVLAHERTKPNRNGQDKITLPPDLPVKTIVIDIPDEEKICRETGQPLVQIGVEVSHKLAHEPGSYYVKEIIRPKYANPQREEEGIRTAELPDTILPKCRADESLLADIITKKFADHLPLNRIAEILARENIKISRKLLSQWVLKCGLALKPLYDEMLNRILASGNIFIDESPVKLFQRKKCKTAYMWVVVGGAGANPSYRIYEFRGNRCHDNVLDILKNIEEVFILINTQRIRGFSRSRHFRRGSVLPPVPIQ